ncbi:MAG: protein kinase [Oscillospiraceae bacterium]|nr:protein kinase [Oscillospiraceae bacterium]
MQDLFDRIAEYEVLERYKGWGADWKPYKEEREGRWVRIAPKNPDDRRRLYVIPFRFDEKGIYDQNEALTLLEEKRAYMEKVQNLGKTAVYTCGVDYAAVKELEEGGQTVGFDVLLRHVPMVPVQTYLRTNDAAARKARQLLQGTGPDIEEDRNRAGEMLAGHLTLALQEVYHAGLSHGHINPEHILMEADGSSEEIRLSIPGEDALFKSAADDRKTTDYYTAPELIADESRPADMQSDLYSVGLLLYQLLNEGRMPFESDAVSREEAAHIRNSGEQPIPAPKNGSRLLQYIAVKSCAHDRADRYQDAPQLLEDLKHADSKVLNGFALSSLVTIGAAAKQRRAAAAADKQRQAEQVRAEAARMQQAQKTAQAAPVDLSKKTKAKKEPPKPAPMPVNTPQQHPSASGGSAHQNAAAFSDGAPVQNAPMHQGAMQAAPRPQPMPQPGYAGGQAPPPKPFNPAWILVPIILVVIITIALLIGAISMMSKLGSGQGSLSANSSGSVSAERDESAATKESLAPTEAPTTIPTEPPTQPPTDPPTEPPTTEPPYVPPTYIVVQGKYTWEEAQAECKARGGHLATVHSNEEWLLLMDTVSNAQLSNSNLKYLWMGGLSELKERPDGEMYAEFKWVDGSDVTYITDKSRFGHWFYNAELDIYEPSGYDAYEYLKNNKKIAEPYLLLWNVAAKKGADLKWSLNDVGDVSSYPQYKESNMGFVMELD